MIQNMTDFNPKSCIIIIFILLLNSFGIAQQKVIIYDELSQKNIANTHVLFNNENVKTDENGEIEYQKALPINIIKIKGFEDIIFEQNKEPFLQLSAFRVTKNIEEIILKKQNYTKISNFKTSNFSYSLTNNATLLNYFKVKNNQKGKKIKSISIKFNAVDEHCGKVYLKPVLYTVKNGSVGEEIISSYELYEIDNSNLHQTLIFSEAIELKANEYFIGFRLYNMKKCKKPYLITSKILSNPSFFNLTDRKDNKWLKTSNINNSKYINFGYTLYLF